MIAPGSIVLIGMLFFGNLLKESSVTERLAAQRPDGDDRHRDHPAGLLRGCQHQAQTFLHAASR